jgi:hypothetical protein
MGAGLFGLAEAFQVRMGAEDKGRRFRAGSVA